MDTTLVTAKRRSTQRGIRRTCLTCLVSRRSCASRRPKLGRSAPFLDPGGHNVTGMDTRQMMDMICIYTYTICMLIENRCFSERRTCYVATYCDSIGYRFWWLPLWRVQLRRGFARLVWSGHFLLLLAPAAIVSHIWYPRWSRHV